MAGDLPDYTRSTTVNVVIPEVEVGPVNVARYQSSPANVSDGERTAALADVKGRLIVAQHEKDRAVETLTGKYVRVKGHATDAVPASLADQEIIPRPRGSIIGKGSITTTSAYQTVASRVVTSGKTFQLAKILVSCPEDVLYKLRWNNVDISAEVYVAKKIPLTDWFPQDYASMVGDGSKAFDIQAKYPSGGSAATCFAEIDGEED